MKDDKRHAELVSASMNEIPNQVRDDSASFRDDSDSKYSDILDYDWNYDSLPNRMPLSQRAKIFLPFAALTGFDEAIQKTIDQEIAELGE
ncbi:hypothetical protein [Treponema bryantii]|uniref:hypothetical protein n=1 Tax=Treponema bryantii TaxID=163 RepID=UPI0003B5DE00|nr:hypothetical protein [Treponema bryantii]